MWISTKYYIQFPMCYFTWVIGLHLSTQVHLAWPSLCMALHDFTLHCTALQVCCKPLQEVWSRPQGTAERFPTCSRQCMATITVPCIRPNNNQTSKWRIIPLPVLLRQWFLTLTHVKIIAGIFEKYWSQP